ncbi:MAG: hypothetical protein VB858_22140, partial [Planctomycetaceae bacterium]
VTGTVRYMAPERFAGESNQTSDLYSLGLTLYELSSRQPAFTSEDRGTLIEAIAQGNLTPLTTVDRSIPLNLALIIGKACSPNAADRYQSASDFGSDLEQFINDQPVSVKPQPTRMNRWIPWRS